MGTTRRDKASIGKYDKAGKERPNKASIGKDDKVGTRERDNKDVAKSVARFYYIEIQRILPCTFLFVLHSNFFFALSSLESVIG